MNDAAETRLKLRELRDRLAIEAPRARTRKAPADLVQRLETTLQLVGGVYLATSATRAADSMQEAAEDAVAEAHLALHDWERWLEREKQPREAARQRPLRLPDLPNRRAHERQETNVTVQVLRYSVREDAGTVSLASTSVSRPARNISVGGIFVILPKDNLSEVGTGAIVHVSVSIETLVFQARAAVTRRDADGIALRWIVDSERVQRSIESLLQAVGRARAISR